MNSTPDRPCSGLSLGHRADMSESVLSQEVQKLRESSSARFARPWPHASSCLRCKSTMVLAIVQSANTSPNMVIILPKEYNKEPQGIVLPTVILQTSALHMTPAQGLVSSSDRPEKLVQAEALCPHPTLHPKHTEHVRLRSILQLKRLFSVNLGSAVSP